MQADREHHRIQQLRADVEAAVLVYVRRCVAAAAGVIREALPTAAAVEIDLREWFDQVAGVRLLLVRDNAGDPIAVDRSAGWGQARLDAEMYLHDALEFARPDLCGWERLDHDRLEYPEQDRYLVTLPSEMEDEHGSGPDASGERSWELISKDQAEEWAGRALTDEDMDRLDDAIPHSSIPDAISTIVCSFDLDEDDDEVDSFAESGRSA
ncbi:hypothetical protein SUDANB95_07862 (plasmid) [Actinosynnema sp. ALI-1.44]